MRFKKYVRPVLIHLAIFIGCTPLLFAFLFASIMGLGSGHPGMTPGKAVGLVLFFIGMSMPFIISFFVNIGIQRDVKYNLILLGVLLVIYHVSMKVFVYGF